jgi:hypothetical protein
MWSEDALNESTDQLNYSLCISLRALRLCAMLIVSDSEHPGGEW